MKKTFTFLAFVMLLSLSCFAQIEKGWRVTVKVHLPKGDTSKVQVFASNMHKTSIDTIRAERVKGNTYYFKLWCNDHFFIATSDKYETALKHVTPVGVWKDAFVDLYLKTPRKEPVKSPAEEKKKLLELMMENYPYPELLNMNNEGYDVKVK